MRKLLMVTPIAVLVLLGGDTQRLSAEQRGGRFTMMQTDNGFVRLDTETGAVSTCTRKDGAFKCELTVDDRAKMQGELDRLQAENEELRQEVAKLKAGPVAPGRPQLKLPSEQDIDRSFDYLERLWRKFNDRLKRLEEQKKPERQL